MLEGAITRSRKRRFNTFTPHLQKIANSREETNNFEAKFMYNVSSMSQEEIGVKMTWKKSYSLEDDMKDKKSVSIL